MHALAVGKKYGLAVDGERIVIFDLLTGILHDLSDCLDNQIKKLKEKDISLSVFSENGAILALVSTTGLLVFFNLEGEFHMTEKNKYTTLRVVYSDGRILPFRTAIEDQFKYSISACPFSLDGTILVPFQIVLDERFAVVRVQAPERSSCLVRIAFLEMQDDLDSQVSTRQALVSPDWLFIYEMGIIDLKIRHGVVLILTHTCLVEFFLCDHDPAPIALSLPDDRVGVIFSEKYIKFTLKYRAYIEMLQSIDRKAILKNKSHHDDCMLIPPEWTVLYAQYKTEEKNALVQLQERRRPRISLREEMQIVTEPCDDEKLLQAVMVFADTSPSLACPWTELAATGSTLYLNTFHGVFVCGADWERLISRKTGQPVYAMSIFATEKDLFVQDGEDKNWRKFDTHGNEIDFEISEPLLNVCDGKLMTKDYFLYADPTAPTSDALLGSTKRSYKFGH